MTRLFGRFGRPDPCEQAQEAILAGAGAGDAAKAAAPRPADITRHIASCAVCRELEEAIQVTHRIYPAWRNEEPPRGLALRTVEYLEPHWRRKEKPLSREEIRMIWTGGLGMVGAAAALLLVVFDVKYPSLGGFAAEGLVKLGARLTLLQIIGGTILSVVLLAIRAARSTETEPRTRPDRNRGGSE